MATDKKSNSDYIYLSGIAKWARLVEPDEKYRNWQITLYLDERSKKTFDKSGLSLEPKSDDDGVYIKLRCPTSKLIKDDLVKFDPPKVIDKNKNPIDGNIVGNGSKVRCNVIVFNTQKGKGHRLLEVMVEDLVEYRKREEGPDDKPF